MHPQHHYFFKKHHFYKKKKHPTAPFPVQHAVENKKYCKLINNLLLLLLFNIVYSTYTNWHGCVQNIDCPHFVCDWWRNNDPQSRVTRKKKLYASLTLWAHLVEREFYKLFYRFYVWIVLNMAKNNGCMRAPIWHISVCRFI